MKIFFLCLSMVLLAHGLHGTEVEDFEEEETTEPYTSGTVEPSNCPEGFVSLEDRCYFFGTSGQTWYNALKMCNALGTSLASLETLHENVIVREYLQELDPERQWDFWISASDDSQEGVFVWVNSMELVEYTDWCGNDPNNVNDESCVHMVASCEYRWEERSCDSFHRFICEV